MPPKVAHRAAPPLELFQIELAIQMRFVRSLDGPLLLLSVTIIVS